MEDFLEHYGVKGMKWGIRKSAAAQNRLIKVAAARKAKTFSDADLKAKVNRLNMEKQYTTLIAESKKVSPSKLEKAAVYVGGVVQSNADRAVRRTTKSVVNMTVDNYVTKGNLRAIRKKATLTDIVIKR